MKKIVSIIFVLAVCLYASGASAHYRWFNIDNDTPKQGENVTIEIGWGHKFPKDTTIEKGMLNNVYALNSKGVRLPLKQKGVNLFEFIAPKEGPYTLHADVHSGFVSKTTKGYQLQSKKGLDNAVFCFQYNLMAKAFLIVKDNLERSFQAVDAPLEIIPQKTPQLLKTGDYLPVRIIFKGKPLCSAEVNATYAGFSEKPSTFAQTAKTDDQGVARLKITEKGGWLINVNHEVPYPDRTECDKYKYNASFTFNVR